MPFLVAIVVIFLFLVIRPRWWKTAVVVLVLWGVAVSEGAVLDGWIHILPLVALVMFFRGYSNSRKRQTALVVPTEPVQAETEVAEREGEAVEENQIEGQAEPEPGIVNIQECILQILEEQFGAPGLQFGPDGSVALTCGSALVVVRTRAEPLQVQVVAPFLGSVAMTPALLDAINELNRTMPMQGRVYWDSETLILASEVRCDPFVPEHFAEICGQVGAAADDLDDRFHQEFGGTLLSPNVSGADIEESTP